VNNIPELSISRNTKEDILLVCTIVLLGATSFGLGRLSASQDTESLSPITVCNTASVGALENGSEAEQDTATAEEGQYVASKNGTVYHLPWCSGAKRINEENKIWFATKAEAEAAGYRPATNCKGI